MGATSEGSLSTAMFEAREGVETRLRMNVNGLHKLCMPENPQREERSRKATGAIATRLEADLSRGVMQDTSFDDELPGSQGTLDPQKFHRLDDLRGLRMLQSAGGHSAADVLSGLEILVAYVTRHVQSAPVSSLPQATDPPPQHLTLAEDLADALGSDKHASIGAILVHSGSKAPAMSTLHRPENETSCAVRDDLLLFVVADGEDANSKDLYARLFQCTAAVFGAQPMRCFAWGMVVLGTAVHVCFFGHDYALASLGMDIAARSGRAELVQFLCNWSFAEPHRLGYHPCWMRYMAEKHCGYWVFDVPAAGGSALGPEKPHVRSFRVESMTMAADRLFDRHTRGFVAVDLETGDRVFVKDYWAATTDGGSTEACDEAKHLCDIAEGLKGCSELDGTYPKLAAGGTVRYLVDIGDSRFVWATHTTQEQLGSVFEAVCAGSGSKDRAASARPAMGTGLYSSGPTIVATGSGAGFEGIDGQALGPLLARVHKCLVMTPVGRPMYELGSVFELIIVMRDVMKLHSEILLRCGILHRDISPSNIMFTGKGSTVRGILVDFDHAVNLGMSGGVAPIEQVGTLPYMSIGNLEGNENPRTALDDWESAIYVLCTRGVIGLNEEVTPISQIRKHPEITWWRRGDRELRALSKRSHLHEWKQFGVILHEFSPTMNPLVTTTDGKFGLLAQVVRELRYVLIDDYTDAHCKGAYVMAQDEEEEEREIHAFKSLTPSDFKNIRVAPLEERPEEMPDVDPFCERAKIWKDVVPKLMARLDKFAVMSRKILQNFE